MRWPPDPLASTTPTMYQIENWKQVYRLRSDRGRSWLTWPSVSRNVLFLGLTSMFTDISSEMVSTVLPLYLVLYLQFSPMQFGVIDGLQQGAAAIVRVGGGLVADRWRWHKQVAVAGYGLSAVCKPALLAVGNVWGGLIALIVVDRIGKGIRTAPRDALISLSTPREQLGTAFGIHRALDTLGAMFGPLLAFGLLALAPGAFDAVFVVSFCAAAIGLGLLVLFVENRASEPANGSDGQASLLTALSLLRVPRFRTLMIVSGALSLMTMSDGFLYLGLQRRLDFDAGLFPLLYVSTALLYFLFAVPAGRLADRFGRARVFVGGHVLLLVVYSSLLLPAVGSVGLLAYLPIYGAYYAATDGVLMAIASVELPPALRASGMALLTTATGLARLLSSVLFGAMWSWWGVETTVALFAAGLIAGTCFAAYELRRTSIGVPHA